jgi:hypothetical protein
MNFTQMIPIRKPSGLLPRVEDKTIVDLQQDYGCFIQRKPAEPSMNRPWPYFLVKGDSEKNVNLVVIELYEVLNDVLSDWIEFIINSTQEADLHHHLSLDNEDPVTQENYVEWVLCDDKFVLGYVDINGHPGNAKLREPDRHQTFPEHQLEEAKICAEKYVDCTAIVLEKKNGQRVWTLRCGYEFLGEREANTRKSPKKVGAIVEEGIIKTYFKKGSINTTKTKTMDHTRPCNTFG